MSARPVLKGITVVEAASGLAGPMAGCRLADLGANVVKVEWDDGAWMRRQREHHLEAAPFSRIVKRCADVFGREPFASLEKRGHLGVRASPRCTAQLEDCMVGLQSVVLCAAHRSDGRDCSPPAKRHLADPGGYRADLVRRLESSGRRRRFGRCLPCRMDQMSCC